MTTRPLVPDAPGVYFFKNSEGVVIYIGKALSLKKRIAAYFGPVDIDHKTAAMIQEHTALEYVVTHSVQEAELLEATLIKEHKPKYNILLKEGNPFLYIYFQYKEYPASMSLVRFQDKKGHYYGPFLQKATARTVYEFLQKEFRLTLCFKKIPKGCLKYHLGICAGSCLDNFDYDHYCFRLELAEMVLKHNDRDFVAAIKDKIAYYNSTFAFEKSRELHFYLQHLQDLFNTMKMLETTSNARGFTTAPQGLPGLTVDEVYALSNDLKVLSGASDAVETIDCFDISHFQSRALVGSCVRFVNGVVDTQKARRFAIKGLTIQNDYAALQEIVQRRYRQLDDLPDLILIDGGIGQRNAVIPIAPQGVPVISIAKREERIYSHIYPNGIIVNPTTLMGKTLIALRDYAHHFAISYHRKKRSKMAVL